MKEKEFYVYEHYRADDNLVFYVGKGIRYRAWVEIGRSTWWHAVKEKHGVIVKIVYSSVNEQDVLNKEIELIEKHKSDGMPLVNLTNGGEGMSGYDMPESVKIKKLTALKSESVRKVISDKAKARWLNPEYKQKQIELIKKSNSNPEIKKKIRDSLILINSDPLVRKKKSDASIENWKSPEYRDKVIKAARLGIIAQRCKPFICVEENKQFITQVEASEWLRSIGKSKARNNGISRALNGFYKQAYGFHWRYV